MDKSPSRNHTVALLRKPLSVIWNLVNLFRWTKDSCDFTNTTMYFLCLLQPLGLEATKG